MGEYVGDLFAMSLHTAVFPANLSIIYIKAWRTYMENKTTNALREQLLAGKPAKKGSLTARDRITALFDEGTFTEIGAFTMRRVSEFDQKTPDEFESVICGYGSIDDRLVYAFAQDMGRTKGSVSEAAAKKICSIYKLALENGCPVVGVFDSAGAYLPEGVRALAGYGTIMKAVAAASGVIPQIAVVAGVATGANAILASMFDFVIATNDSEISVNPPFVVGGGKADNSVEAGVASVIAATDADALAKARELLSYLPSNNEEGTAEWCCTDDANRACDISAYEQSGEISALIAAFADDAKFFELGAGYAESVKTGFVSLGGTVCGVVATDRAVNAGKLSSKSARKAARFISFCDCHSIPVVTLVDCEGFEISAEEEKNPYCSEIGKLALTYASAKTALITLVAGAAYGSAFSVLGSKSIGADVVFALDSAKIACMNAKSAVALLWNNKISSKTSREDLEAQWSETEANVALAAKAGEVDDIIDSAEVRQRLASAVNMLSCKAGAPRRRHANMPL